MTAAHSPRPWTAREVDGSVEIKSEATGFHIAVIAYEDFPETTEGARREARRYEDIRLMLASPDLLASAELQEAYEAIDGTEESMEAIRAIAQRLGIETHAKTAAQIVTEFRRSAIAKAKG